jgi:hypothetical protein
LIGIVLNEGYTDRRLYVYNALSNPDETERREFMNTRVSVLAHIFAGVHLRIGE